ncbi:MAG: hypothetical protein RL141_1072 [Candidatus Parcubacteria bacterium]
MGLMGLVCFSHGAVAGEELKTLTFFVGQSTAAVSSVSWPVTFYVGDTVSTSTHSAFIVLNGVSPASGSLTLDLSLDGGNGTCPLSRTIDTTGRNNAFTLLYDVNACIAMSGAGSYTRTLNVTVTGGSVDALSAALALTYQHAVSATLGDTAMKTLLFSMEEGTQPTTIAAGGSATWGLPFYVGDELTSLQGAYVEINGMSVAAASATLDVSLQGGSGSCPLSRVIDTTGTGNAWTLLYDVAPCLDVPSKGSYDRSLLFTATGADVTIATAKLVLTYEFTPPASGYPISAVLISPTFDTAAVNGSSFNWIMWKGSLNSGRIRLRLATSHCANGATDAPGCTSGSWGSGSNFVGPDCTTATFFEQTDTALATPVGCEAQHHNKRYFRYQATLCSDDCVNAGANTPSVSDVIVNWSP